MTPDRLSELLRMILFFLVLGLGSSMPAGAADDWVDFPDDFDAGAVNEGELEFLARPPDAPVHTHHNRIRLTASSLVDGWAQLRQCHTHLDPVPSAQIVFRPGRIRQLQVERHAGIESVAVEGNSVQLDTVTPGAELCLSAESRVVVPQPDGGFLVRNGPYMRSFLDGFYPMHVLLEISLPPGRWTLLHSEPRSQPGFSVVYHAGKVSVDTWFSGQLHTRFSFAPDPETVTESQPDKDTE